MHLKAPNVTAHWITDMSSFAPTSCVWKVTCNILRRLKLQFQLQNCTFSLIQDEIGETMTTFLFKNKNKMEKKELTRIKENYTIFIKEYVLIQYCRILTNNINEVESDSCLLLNFFEFLMRGKMSQENVYELAAWVFVNQNKGAFRCNYPNDMIQMLKTLDFCYNEELFITPLCKFVIHYCEIGKTNGSLKQKIKTIKEKGIPMIYDIAPGLSKHIYQYQRSIDKWVIRCPFFNGNCLKKTKLN